MADRARVRPVAAGSRDGATARPTPLRARMERPPTAPSTTAVLEPASAPTVAPTGEVAQQEPAPPREIAHEAPRVRRFASVPPAVVAGAAVVVVVLAAIGYLLAPRLGPMLADDTLDPARLPNTSAVAAGTPVSQVASPRNHRITLRLYRSSSPQRVAHGVGCATASALIRERHARKASAPRWAAAAVLGWARMVSITASSSSESNAPAW